MKLNLQIWSRDCYKELEELNIESATTDENKKERNSVDFNRKTKLLICFSA